MDKNSQFLFFLSFLFALTLSSCSSSSGSGDDTETSTTYSTTSTKGDYSEWTLTGSDLEVTWQSINDTGGVDNTIAISASCSAPAANSTRDCTIDSASCTDGLAVCGTPPSGSFTMMNVPGVALFAQTDSGTLDEQLHIGFVKNSDACSDDVSGDYTFIRSGLGLHENFGMYRSDANFINILHSDFGFDTADANMSQAVSYRTGSESNALTDGGCSSGVRVRVASGTTIRSMMTGSGLFVLDFPAGEGGLLSFKVSNAASLADFANKSFAGISFPDNDDPEFLTATFGAVAGDQIDFTANVGGNVLNQSIMDLGTADTMTGPPYPDFMTSPVDYGSSVLSATYATPADIPGLFKLDQLSDSGRVILAAMNFNNKVIGIGMVYNYRTTTDIDPSAGDGVTTFSSNGLYNTGNFILFEQ